jgi:hypothetical protein
MQKSCNNNNKYMTLRDGRFDRLERSSFVFCPMYRYCRFLLPKRGSCWHWTCFLVFRRSSAFLQPLAVYSSGRD